MRTCCSANARKDIGAALSDVLDTTAPAAIKPIAARLKRRVIKLLPNGTALVLKRGYQAVSCGALARYLVMPIAQAKVASGGLDEAGQRFPGHSGPACHHNGNWRRGGFLPVARNAVGALRLGDAGLLCSVPSQSAAPSRNPTGARAAWASAVAAPASTDSTASGRVA